MQLQASKTRRRSIFAELAAIGLVFLLGCVNSIHIQAQTTTATVSGTITDPQGLSVAGADVMAKNVATGVESSAASDQTGQYILRNLVPGTYGFRVVMNGFKTAEAAGVVLHVNQATSVDFQLQLGEVAQTVAVTAEAAQLDTMTSEIGTVIEEKRILDLPLNGRQFYQLITLSPGVSPVSRSQNKGDVLPQNSSGGALPSVAGQNNRTSMYTMDGVYNNEPFFSGYNISPPIDAVQEFKVQAHNDMAEFGGVLGGTVNLVTKTGTNQLHGSVYEFLRNEVLDARNFFDRNQRDSSGNEIPDSARGPFRQNQFGFSVGGPVLLPGYKGRNRTFFFGSYEGFRYTRSNTRLTTVPTAAMRSGDFTGENSIFNPFTTPRTPFSNNQIPSNLINQGIAEYLKIIPLPNLPGRTLNFVNLTPATNNFDTFLARVDHNWGTHDYLFGRFAFADTDFSEPEQLPGNMFNIHFPARNVGIGWNHIFSPTLITHFLAGYVRHARQVTRTLPNRDAIFNAGFSDGFPIGTGGLSYPQPPGMNVSNYFRTRTTTAWQGPMNIWQMEGTITKVWGRHTLKGGFSFYKPSVYTNGGIVDEGFTNLETAELNDPSNTGNAFASFLLGLPSRAFRSLGDQSFRQFSEIYGAFVQDQINVSPKLTLNLGLRFDYLSPPTELFDRFAGFDVHTGLYLLAKIPPPCPEADYCLSAPLPVGVAETRRSYIDPDWGNFAPRFGFAYRIQPRTVIRAGFGMAYDNWSGVNQGSDNVRGNWPGGLTQNVSGLNAGLGTPGGPAPLFATNPFVGLPTLGSPTPFPAGNTYALNRFLKNPYVYSWNLDIQRELAQVWKFTIGYVGSKGTLIKNNAFLNTARIPGPGPVAPRTDFPEQGGLFVVENNDNAVQYHSLQAKAERRFRQGFSLLASYTWSKSMDRCSGYFGAEGCDRQFMYDSFGDRAVSVYDLPHILTLSYLYELPLGKGKAHLSQGIGSWILGNWQLSGIATFYSGIPFTVALPFDNANVGIGSTRPDLIADPNTGPKTREQWFNTAAFAAPPPYSFGTAGRNVVRADGFQNWDFGLRKNFPITETARVEFRTEFFNFLNHTTFGTPGSTFGSPTFGVVSSARDSREIQFALKVYF